MLHRSMAHGWNKFDDARHVRDEDEEDAKDGEYFDVHVTEGDKVILQLLE